MKCSHTLLALSLLGLSSCNEPQYIHVGPNWAAIHNLQPSERSFKVRVQKVKPQYRVGETFQFRVNSTQPGRLWVVQVDSEDQISKLYPNDYLPNNQIGSERWVEIPPTGAKWSLEANEPLGKSVLAFVVTTNDTDLHEVLKQQGSMSKALRLVEQSPRWGLSKKVVDVVKAQ